MKKITIEIDRSASTEILKKNIIQEITNKLQSSQRIKKLKEQIPQLTKETKEKLKELQGMKKPIINILKVEGKKYSLKKQIKNDEEIFDAEPNTEYELRIQYIQRKDQDINWAYKIGEDKKNINKQSIIRIKIPNTIISKEDNNFVLVGIYKFGRLVNQTKVNIICTELFIEGQEIHDETEITFKNPRITIHDISESKPIEIINTNEDKTITLTPGKKYRISTFGIIGGEGIIEWSQTIDPNAKNIVYGSHLDLTPKKTGEITCNIEKNGATEGITKLTIKLEENTEESSIEYIVFTKPSPFGQLKEVELDKTYPFEFDVIGNIPHNTLFEIYINKTNETNPLKQKRERLLLTKKIRGNEIKLTSQTFERGQKYSIWVIALNEKGNKILKNRVGVIPSSTIGLKIKQKLVQNSSIRFIKPVKSNETFESKLNQTINLEFEAEGLPNNYNLEIFNTNGLMEEKIATAKNTLRLSLKLTPESFDLGKNDIEVQVYDLDKKSYVLDNSKKEIIDKITIEVKES